MMTNRTAILTRFLLSVGAMTLVLAAGIHAFGWLYGTGLFAALYLLMPYETKQ